MVRWYPGSSGGPRLAELATEQRTFPKHLTLGRELFLPLALGFPKGPNSWPVAGVCCHAGDFRDVGGRAGPEGAFFEQLDAQTNASASNAPPERVI